jgi:hypothetical protein
VTICFVHKFHTLICYVSLNCFSFVCQKSLDVDVLAFVNSIILKPTEVVCDQMQFFAPLASYKHDSVLVAVFAECSRLFSPTNSFVFFFGVTSVHHHHQSSFLVLPILNPLDVFIPNIVSKFLELLFHIAITWVVGCRKIPCLL